MPLATCMAAVGRRGRQPSPGSSRFTKVFAIIFYNFLYEHTAWKKDEIKKSKNESPIRYTWSTRKEAKKLTLLHTYILLWILQIFFFEICTIFLLYKSKKFAKGTCHRKPQKIVKKTDSLSSQQGWRYFV